jgi:integrase
MLGLRWSAVDMRRGVIRLFHGETKNDEGRTLAIAGPLAEIMARREAARLVERPNGEPVVADLVFHNRGRRIVDYRRAWAKARKAAGFTCQVVNEKTGRRELGRRMHDLRRTAARDRVDDGTPDRVVMAMTGHRTRAMFDRYSIASTRDIEAALLKATLPAGTPVAQKRNPVAGVLQRSGQKTEAPKMLKSWGLAGCGGAIGTIRSMSVPYRFELRR